MPRARPRAGPSFIVRWTTSRVHSEHRRRERARPRCARPAEYREPASRPARSRSPDQPHNEHPPSGYRTAEPSDRLPPGVALCVARLAGAEVGGGFSLVTVDVKKWLCSPFQGMPKAERINVYLKKRSAGRARAKPMPALLDHVEPLLLCGDFQSVLRLTGLKRRIKIRTGARPR